MLMIIYNCKIITWEQPNQIVENKAILIQKGLIKALDSQIALFNKFPDEERLDAGGQYIMPGNICAHTHFYGTFSRGMAIPGKAAKDFPEILDKLWWPLDKSLSTDAVKYSALVCLVNAVRHGTTTLLDHHASQTAIDGSLEVIAEAVEQAGVRASLCYEVTDRDGLDRMREGVAENLRHIDYVKRNPGNGRIKAHFGMHASLTLSQETLEYCRNQNPDDIGFHIHAAEHISDQFDSLDKSGMRVIDRLYKHGILGEKSIIVHAVQTDAKEIALLAETNSIVTHQPRSNMNNAVGMAQIESMLRAGILLGLGNDGFSNAMWEEWKTAYLAHKMWHRDPRVVSGYDVVQMAVYNNSKIASRVFDDQIIGSIEVGAKADFIFVDYHPFTELSAGNLPWHIIFGFHESMITSTMVDGKFLMKDRELLTLDEKEIAAKALEISKGTWGKYHKSF
ncbi:MAG: putative aminohydrolase SsnA [Bacteroidales bacterium]|nr:putative aminohydrolase SsnA [Bacteroidales bacterium]